jgi:hypothetical protein
MWWREPDAVRDFFAPGMSALAAQREESVPETQAIRVKDIDLALAEYRKIKSKTGLLGLSAFSEDCFAGQSRSASARALDYCVAFDHAVADYGEKTAGDDLPQLPRFRPEQLDVRHEFAARLVSDDQNWIDTRRAALRNLTFERWRLRSRARFSRSRRTRLLPHRLFRQRRARPIRGKRRFAATRRAPRGRSRSKPRERSGPTATSWSAKATSTKPSGP